MVHRRAAVDHAASVALTPPRGPAANRRVQPEINARLQEAETGKGRRTGLWGKR